MAVGRAGEDSGQSGRRRAVIARAAALAIAFALGATGSAWAASVLFHPPSAPVMDSQSPTARASYGTVESSMNLTAIASWQRSFVAVNQAAGTLTSVAAGTGQQVQEGDVLYTVDLRPVRIAKGDVPSFRSLSIDSTGPDVKQLLGLLSSLGYYAGVPDEVFGAQARRAVEKYQRAENLPVDGTFPAGDVVYVPTLPARVVLDTETLAVGVGLHGGERGIAVLDAEPTFSVPLAEGQAMTAAPGTPVEIESEGETWHATIARQEGSADPGSKEVAAILAPSGADSICHNACGTIPTVGRAQFSARIVLQSPTEGVTIPAVAVASGADENSFVTDTGGRRHRVTIVASAKGMVVVEGLSVGTMVRLPSKPADARG